MDPSTDPSPAAQPAAPVPLAAYGGAAYPGGPVPPGAGPTPTKPPLSVPDGPRVYANVLRGPTWAWWKPLVSVPVIALAVLAMLTVVSIFSLIAMELSGGVDLTEEGLLAASMQPVPFLLNNLGLASGILAAVLAVRITFGTSGRFALSVQRRWRWGFFARALAIMLVPFALYFGASFALDPPAGDPVPHVWLMLAIVLVTTPLQCAGEEFFFRGLLTQWVGGYFRDGRIGTVVAALVSGVAFGFAHGAGDPLVTVQLSLFGMFLSYLVWRTGGLEAATAMHILNNVIIFVVLGFAGGYESSMATEATGSWLAIAVELVLCAAVAGVVEILMRRPGHPANRYVPDPAEVERYAAYRAWRRATRLGAPGPLGTPPAVAGVVVGGVPTPPPGPGEASRPGPPPASIDPWAAPPSQ